MMNIWQASRLGVVDGHRRAYVKFREIWDPRLHPEESVPCNLCGRLEGFVRRGVKDRYGFDVTCVQCPDCGLVFLNPRMTREAYAEFYQRAYRPLVSVWAGRTVNAQTIKGLQRAYADELSDFLPQGLRATQILDVGGSTGVVAAHIARLLGAEATVLDPSGEELKEAGKAGLLTCRGFVEDVVLPNGRYDLILLCQTVDHLLDISGTLRRLREALAPGGHLFVDIVDYDQTRTIKIDHPFNLTRQTMEAFLSKTGFQVVTASGAARLHVSYLCEAA